MANRARTRLRRMRTASTLMPSRPLTSGLAQALNETKQGGGTQGEGNLREGAQGFQQILSPRDQAVGLPGFRRRREEQRGGLAPGALSNFLGTDVFQDTAQPTAEGAGFAEVGQGFIPAQQGFLDAIERELRLSQSLEGHPVQQVPIAARERVVGLGLPFSSTRYKCQVAFVRNSPSSHPRRPRSHPPR